MHCPNPTCFDDNCQGDCLKQDNASKKCDSSPDDEKPQEPYCEDS